MGAGILFFLAWPVKAQFGAQSETGARVTRSWPEANLGEVVRAIDDPPTGNYWLLERDPRHPGGPGRMVLVSRTQRADEHSRTGEFAGSSGAAEGPAQNRLTPIIRAGDPLVVYENTLVVEARLEAVALGPAVLGATFQVRLRIGGRVVRAVALGAGRAAFADQIGARP